MTATAEQGRTLVKTTAVGWYIDANDPDGKRVRKTEGDTIVTQDEYEGMKALVADGHLTKDDLPEGPNADSADTTTKARDTEKRNGEHRTNAAAAAPTTLTSGKQAVGPTVEIQCAWVDPENRTKAQQKLFEGPTSAITYEKVVKAAGGDEKAMPSGEKRVIKKQDQFQVRFSVENQKKHRNELRRRKTGRRRAEREAAKS